MGSQTPNRQLLWHGSRLSNYVGILSQGLRIAPPSAPVTGYMFGKVVWHKLKKRFLCQWTFANGRALLCIIIVYACQGVYFADCVSKSANYCNAATTNNTAIMILCEVALGGMNELYNSDYNASNLPSGSLSTKGVCGRCLSYCIPMFKHTTCWISFLILHCLEK